MKPFATLGSEISKVRERVRRGAEALRPTKVASDVRDQRDRLLAKLGEQTFRLIAERKLQVPKVLQDSVDKLAALLGVQLPSNAPEPLPETEGEAASTRRRQSALEGASADASHPIEEPVESPEVDEPSLGDTSEAAPAPSRPAPAPKKKRPTQKKTAKRRNKR